MFLGVLNFFNLFVAMPVKHIVIMKFKSDCSPETLKEAGKNLVELKGTVFVIWHDLSYHRFSKQPTNSVRQEKFRAFLTFLSVQPSSMTVPRDSLTHLLSILPMRLHWRSVLHVQSHTWTMAFLNFFCISGICHPPGSCCSDYQLPEAELWGATTGNGLWVLTISRSFENVKSFRPTSPDNQVVPTFHPALVI